MEAQLFDGTILEFPDGTSQEVIERVAREETAKRKAAAAGQDESPAVTESPSALADVAQSLPSGVVRGAAETAMLPVTLERAGQGGMDWLYRAIFGPGDPATIAKIDAARSGGRIGDQAQDAVRNTLNDVLHEPKTTAGEYAETVGEFLAPGGVPSKAARLAPTASRKIAEYGADIVRNAVTPALISEGAGQATEGTSFETPARIAGAAVGNIGGALAKSYNAPETVLRRAAGDPNEIDWERAVGLQNNNTGVRLTGPEAITQAQGGASALPNLLRVVEGSVEGRSATAPFFAERPAQVDRAVGDVLDLIAPQSPNPSVLGPRASEAATNVLDNARQDINTRTRPLYRAAEPQVIPDAQFQAIAADPRFASALERLRNNPDLAPDYAAFPDNSVAVVDAVTKDMAARGEALANSANPLYGPELAGKNAAGAANARAVARDPARGGSAEYDQALREQARARREELQPLEEGPLGKVAAANETSTAGNAILPQNPLTGSQDETADAVRRLLAEDADTTNALVRQNLADRYSKAATETQEGSREFAGAKFNKDVAGNQQRRATLDAVLGEANGGAAAAPMSELLDVLQATGRRKAIGSATEFNRALNADLGTASPTARVVNLAKTLGTSFITNAGDAVKRAALRNSLGELADMFMDPNSVEVIREAIARGPRNTIPEAALRSALQTQILAADERGPR